SSGLSDHPPASDPVVSLVDLNEVALPTERVSCMNYLKGMSVAGLAGAVGDLLTEAGFFKTNFCIFDFGGETAGFQALLGLLNGSLSAAHVDIFSLFSDLSHDGHFGGGNFCIPPQNNHMVGQIPNAIAQLADAQCRKEMTVSR